ncbi:MAG: molybdenum cofactor guanylyltransferase MobA [Paracoccaceae bacterium]
MSAPAVVLAGGAARRMGGGDKGLLTLGGRPLLAHVLERLAGPVALNANGPAERFADWGMEVLPDPVLEGVEDRPGPLAGVLAGMRWAAGRGASRLLTVAWDTPFFPRDLEARLAAAMRPGVRVAMAATPEPARPQGVARHPTFALWDAALADDLAAALRDGVRRVVGFAEPAGCALVVFEDEGAFFNVNAPEDLAEAERRLEAAP